MSFSLPSPGPRPRLPTCARAPGSAFGRTIGQPLEAVELHRAVGPEAVAETIRTAHDKGERRIEVDATMEFADLQTLRGTREFPRT